MSRVRVPGGSLSFIYSGAAYVAPFTFVKKGALWHIQFKKPTSSELRRSDGTISLGVTDNTTKTVTIADNASDYMTDKILCHELVHVYSFSYGCDIDIETEEIIADFMSLYGRNIVYTADKIFNLLEQKYG